MICHAVLLPLTILVTVIIPIIQQNHHDSVQLGQLGHQCGEDHRQQNMQLVALAARFHLQLGDQGDHRAGDRVELGLQHLYPNHIQHHQLFDIADNLRHSHHLHHRDNHHQHSGVAFMHDRPENTDAHKDLHQGADQQ